MFCFASLFLAVVFAAVCGHAAPFVEKRAIEAELLSRLKLMQQYASATYCANNYGSPGDQITCASGKCPLVQNANATSVIEYSRVETSTDVTGFVAIDHTNRNIIVAFRGSSTLDTWLTDLQVAPAKTDICSGCNAHRGFWKSWTDARDRVLLAVRQASATHPTYQIAAIGHSLGGGIATLAAAQLRNYGFRIALYTFGAPRVGGLRISSYITNQPGGNYRVTHWNDPVPKLPPVVLGYVHISPEYYINKPTGQDVQANDINVYQGAINLKGNSAWVAVDTDAHTWYFSSTDVCDAKKTQRGLQIRGVEDDIEILATF